MRTYELTRGPHHDDDAAMTLPEPSSKRLLHLITCGGYHEL